MAVLAVVHLVRKQNGIQAFERFLASFQGHPAGVTHQLVFLFKGFARPESGYERLISDMPHRSLFIPDRGFDINAYFEAARLLEYSRFCFLNSFSRILVDGWLEQLDRWSRADGVGLVGATGSYQSIAGGYTTEDVQLRSLPPTARLWKRVGRALRDRRPNANFQRVTRAMLRVAGVWKPARDFPPFPNPHLRTNAFMISRETLSRIRTRPLRMKVSAYKFESGRDGLTSQINRLGMRTLVIGRDGKGYEPSDWHLSNTFWQSREENLLVADNQTDLYMSGDLQKRSELAQYAWGEKARPAW